MTDDFGQRHRAAVRKMRKALQECIDANEDLVELEKEATQQGLALMHRYALVEIRRPVAGSTTFGLSGWLTRTKAYLEGN